MKHIKTYENTENRQVGDIVKCISSRDSSLIFHNCYTISKISNDKEYYKVGEKIRNQWSNFFMLLHNTNFVII